MKSILTVSNHPFSNHFVANNILSKSPQFDGVSLPNDLIYLDHAAATPICNEAFEAMLPWLTTACGNPANRLHPMGEIAEHGLAQARQCIAKICNVSPNEVFFTSSATESNNLLLRGMLESPMRKRNTIVYVETEHSSIAATAETLAKNFGASLGIKTRTISVDKNGQIDLNEAKKIINSDTLVVCAMDVNNETGIIQCALRELKTLANNQGTFLHVDAAQGFARGCFPSANSPFDSAVISSAKIYGPKGAAALIIKKSSPRMRIEAQLTGGGQESNFRSGTPNIPAIIGFAIAAEMQIAQATQRKNWLETLEKEFLQELEKLTSFHLHGKNQSKAPGLLMLTFPSVNAMKLIEETKNVCMSTGSACRTLQATASHVLSAMGIELGEALASVRISFGLSNTLEEARIAAKRIAAAALRVKNISATLP